VVEQRQDHTARGPADALPTITIRPSGRPRLRLRELWDYRELLYFFTWRELKVRYKQTAIGIGWVILQPLVLMIVFTLFFGRFAHLPSDNLPGPLFYYSGLVPWTYFSRAAANATSSVVQNHTVITKVYFPRLLLPISAIFAGILDLAISIAFLVGLMVYYGVTPRLTIVFVPVVILLAATSALAVGMWFSALNAIYRDAGYATLFIVQIGLFVSPVAYPASLVPERWRSLYMLNPMASAIESFRWALFGRGTAPGVSLLVTFVAVVVLLLAGTLYFRRLEGTMIDVV
jgi:lipopolysaccharide transport system permease protein